MGRPQPGDPPKDGSWRQENHIRQILWLLCHALFCKQSRLGSNPGVKDRVKDVIYISYVISLPQMGNLLICDIPNYHDILCDILVIMIFFLWLYTCPTTVVFLMSSAKGVGFHKRCYKLHTIVGRFFSLQGQETLVWKFLRGELALVILT